MQEKIGEQIIKEIKERVGFLVDVGLEYLTLARLRHPFPVVKPSESVWQPRSAPVW
jgi:excinuclease ABC subunit A